MRLLATRYFAIDLDQSLALIRATRSAVPFDSTDEIDQEVARLGTALDRLHGEWRLLIDLRAISLRNDPAFEAAIPRLRRRLFARASRTAVLVRTAVGALQVTRHVREDRVVAEVFDDEKRALAYLTASSATTPRRREPPPRPAPPSPPPPPCDEPPPSRRLNAQSAQRR